MSNASNPKRSNNARAVAREVIDKVRKGEKVNLTQIQMNNGYTRASAITMKAIKTLSYQEEIAPLISKMTSIQARLLKRIQEVPIDNEGIVNLTIAHKNVLHDKQLMAGKSTENIATTPQIIVYSDADPLSEQLKKSQAGASTEQA